MSRSDTGMTVGQNNSESRLDATFEEFINWNSLLRSVSITETPTEQNDNAPKRKIALQTAEEERVPKKARISTDHPSHVVAFGQNVQHAEVLGTLSIDYERQMSDVYPSFVVQDSNQSAEATAPKQKAGAPKHQSNVGQLVRTPPGTTLAPACGVGIIEFLTWCPRWYLRSAPRLRFLRNRIHHNEMAKVVAWSHELGNAAEVRVANSIKHYNLRFAKRPVVDGGFGGPWYARCKEGNAPSLDTNRATGHWDVSSRKAAEIDMSLLELAYTVLPDRHPSGFDAGVFSQCIQLALKMNDHTLRISDIPAMIARYSLIMPIESGNADRKAMDRFLATNETTGH